MSSKQRFQELLANLKEWAQNNGNDELNSHLNELETEINAMDASYDGGSADDGGGSAPPPEKGRG